MRTSAFKEANEVPADKVADFLGLPAARESGKRACPKCPSSDGLHVYPGAGRGAYCFSCGTAFSAVDLVATARRVPPREALDLILAAFGIGEPPGVPWTPWTPPEAPPVVPEPDSLAPLRPEVYGSLLEALPLGPGGRDYVASRGLDPDHAGEVGLRSLDSSREWQRLKAHLRERHPPEALEVAGFGGNSLPWQGKVPALLLPYWDRTGGQVEAIRWRRIDGGRDRRYMAPRGAGARIPWRLEALDAPRPLQLVVVEGELDALAVVQAGGEALALGGATPAREVLDRVVEGVEEVDRLALWLDADGAGQKAVDRLLRMLVARHGSRWVGDRVELWRSPLDATALAATGALR